MRPALVWTRHVLIRAAERGLPLEWIERVASTPDWTEVEPRDPTVALSFGRIREAGGKVLRVAHVDRSDGRHVLSARFDAKQTRRRGRCV